MFNQLPHWQQLPLITNHHDEWCIRTDRFVEKIRHHDTKTS